MLLCSALYSYSAHTLCQNGLISSTCFVSSFSKKCAVRIIKPITTPNLPSYISDSLASVSCLFHLDMPLFFCSAFIASGYMLCQNGLTTSTCSVSLFSKCAIHIIKCKTTWGDEVSMPNLPSYQIMESLVLILCRFHLVMPLCFRDKLFWSSVNVVFLCP